MNLSGRIARLEQKRRARDAGFTALFLHRDHSFECGGKHYPAGTPWPQGPYFLAPQQVDEEEWKRLAAGEPYFLDGQPWRHPADQAD